MPTRTLELKRLMVLLVMLCLVGCGVIVSPPLSTTLLTSTSTPSVMRSLFVNDTCAPPCWFGLTPGVSTAADAANFFATRTDIAREYDGEFSVFGPDAASLNGDETDGEYVFELRGQWGRPGSVQHGTNTLTIRDGLVYDIQLWSPQHITLPQVIDALGTPDVIRLKGGEFESFYTLVLIYSDALFEVRLHALQRTCNISTLAQDMWVETVAYFSPAAATEQVLYDSDQLQPRLYAYRYGEGDVPFDTWQMWLSGEVDLSCAEAYAHIMPTATP